MAPMRGPIALHRMAESFLELAREEADEGYNSKDMRRVRDAAEKAWLAALQATDGAMQRHGLLPEPGPRAHLTRHEFLEEVGREDLSHELHDFADRLHGRYFYTGAVPDRAGMARALDQVKQYIQRVTEET